jgi:SNF2 family DNA or RNA helicase
MKTSITLHGSRINVSSPYNPVFVERFRQIEGRKFDGDSKEWTFPASKDNLLAVCDVAGLLPFMLSNELQAILRDEGVAPPKAKPVDLSLINGHPFLTKPFPHQRENLARLIANDRWILCDEMGTGKSKAIVDRLAMLMSPRHVWLEPGVDDYIEPAELNVLILCPKSVVTSWVEQLMIHAKLFGEIVQGTAKNRLEALSSPSGIRIANYELLLHSDFSTVAWDVVILDELHRVKNFTAQTSKKVRALTSQARYVWGLSGTPAPNGLEDWLGVLSAINPDLLPTRTKTAFEARYCVKHEIQPGVWKVAGYKNVAELHGFIQSITSRNTKEDVLPDLPAKTFTSRRVSLDGEQARVYRELKKDAVSRLMTLKGEGTLSIKNVLQEGLRLLQVVGGFMPVELLEGDERAMVVEFDKKAKLAALEEVIDELGGRQAVIWCCFVPEVRMLAEWFATQEHTVGTLTGDLSGSERNDNLEDFKAKRTQFFVGTSAAGGTGINQLVGADTCIYYSRNFSLTDFLQSQDRCHRIGTVSPVTIIKLLASGTIDDKIDQALDQKKDVLEMMLRDPGEML